jgi:hypothetical protein
MNPRDCQIQVRRGGIMVLNEGSPSPSPNEPGMFRFIEVGMRLTYEFESLGQIRTSLGHTIEFRPVFSSRGWSTHKEIIASLRLIHLADQSREIGRCLLDQDEVTAWGRLLRPMPDKDCCSDGWQTRSLELETRHGIRMVWQNGINGSFLLYISSQQPAILPLDFASRLLKIFDDFELLSRKYEQG